MNKLAFVFPGQGAQSVGMGRDLYDNSPAARAVFDAVDSAAGFAVSDLCFHGPDEKLKETKNTQPALYAVSVAALAACKEAGLVPSAVAGHSVGEYAALHAAGALSVETGAKLVAARGEAMAIAATQYPGTMAAVLGLDPDAVIEACRETNLIGVVVAANLNAPGQVVISGEVSAINAVSERLKAQGAKRVLPLAVSGAFHSPLMEWAVVQLRDVFADADISAPELPIVANVTADYETTADEIRANLSAQVAGPVRWIETIQRLTADGYTTFIECGSGTVLAGLIKRIAPDAVTYSVGDMAGLAKAKESLGV
jgi:[acyl-carrier-protein] S-malonyltransferase